MQCTKCTRGTDAFIWTDCTFVACWSVSSYDTTIVKAGPNSLKGPSAMNQSCELEINAWGALDSSRQCRLLVPMLPFFHPPTNSLESDGKTCRSAIIGTRKHHPRGKGGWPNMKVSTHILHAVWIALHIGEVCHGLLPKFFLLVMAVRAPEGSIHLGTCFS